MYEVSGYAMRLNSELDADSMICLSAVQIAEDEPIVFVTDDLSCRCIARDIYHLDVVSSDADEDIYKGYIEFKGTADEINDYMAALDTSALFPNQYILLTDTETGKTERNAIRRREVC